MASYGFGVDDDGEEGDGWYFGGDDEVLNVHEETTPGPPVGSKFHGQAKKDPLSLDSSNKNEPWNTPDYWESGKLWDEGIETQVPITTWVPKKPAKGQSANSSSSSEKSGLSWRPTPTTKSNFGQGRSTKENDSLVETSSGEMFDVDELSQNNMGASPLWLKQVLSGEIGSDIPRDDPQVLADWMSRLEGQWTRRGGRPNELQSTLQHCFGTVYNPYTAALYLTESAKDYLSGKTTTLSGSVVKEFEKFIKNYGPRYVHCLDKDTKLYAFRIAVQGSSMILFDPIVKAFQLCHKGNEYFLPVVRNYIGQQKFKEAAQCATKLGLQNHFDIKEICLPLILQDKVNLVEAYVFRNQKQQVDLLQLLDHMVDSGTDITSVIIASKVEDKIQRHKLVPKVLSKLAIRLMKLYSIPAETCPNINMARSLKALRYLLFKRFQENTLHGDQWVDLIRGSVESETWLQEQLVDQLVSYCEMEEAAKWAKFYKLDKNTLPMQVLDLVDDAPDITCPGDTEDTTCDGQMNADFYHQLSLSQENIIFIDTRDDFHACLQSISTADTVVGIDAEWRPTFGQNIANRMALLQLATTSEVYLLDMLALQEALGDDDWHSLGVGFFSNDNVLKLGYAIEGDFQMLIKTFPVMKDSLKSMKRVIDLQVLHRNVMQTCPDLFVVADDESSSDEEEESDSLVTHLKQSKQEQRGLSELVRQCFGKCLDKRQQMSDWERRPLRTAQIIYASLDAYCLLEIYEHLCQKIEQNNLPVNIEPMGGHSVKPRRTKMERKQQRVAEKPGQDSTTRFKMQTPPSPAPRDGPPIRPRELRVVCDNMLQGLGRHLRCCGVDVRILANDDDHDKAGKVGREEERVILTSGAPYYTLRSQVPEGMCFNVAPNKAKDQAAEVLKHFNVTVTESDIFSRCQVCNGNSYLHIHPKELKEAWKIHQSRAADQPAVVTTSAAPSQMGLETPYSNHSGTINRNCDGSYKFDHLDLDTLTVGPYRAPVQLGGIPENMFHSVDVFFVCRTCGKVFWEGSHFAKVYEQFAHVITK